MLPNGSVASTVIGVVTPSLTTVVSCVEKATELTSTGLATAGTVRVKMKDETGKEVEKTFKLTREIRYMDSLGRAATAKVFRAGDQVAVIVNKGKLEEISQARK